MKPKASCQIPCDSANSRLSITPSHVISATDDGTVLLLDINCAHQNLENDPHKKLIRVGKMWDMDWHSSTLAVANDDGVARLWDIETGLKMKEFAANGDRLNAIKMPDDTTVITATGRNSHTIRVWDVVSGQCSHVFRGHTDSITRIDVFGDLFISGSYDQTVRIHDLATGNQLHRLEGHDTYPYIFHFNEDKTLMAVACGGGDIKIWRLADSTCIGICRGHTWVATKLENCNGNLVSASADGTIRIWDWKDGSLIKAVDPAHEPKDGRTNAVRGMVFTARYVITGGFRDGLLKVWDRESYELLSEHHAGIGFWNIIGGEGKLVVSAGLDNGSYKIMLWDKMTIDSEGI